MFRAQGLDALRQLIMDSLFSSGIQGALYGDLGKLGGFGIRLPNWPLPCMKLSVKMTKLKFTLIDAQVTKLGKPIYKDPKRDAGVLINLYTRWALTPELIIALSKLAIGGCKSGQPTKYDFRGKGSIVFLTYFPTSAYKTGQVFMNLKVRLEFEYTISLFISFFGLLQLHLFRLKMRRRLVLETVPYRHACAYERLFRWLKNAEKTTLTLAYQTEQPLPYEIASY